MSVFPMTPDLFDEDELSSAVSGRDARRAGTGEGVKHHITTFRKRFDELLNRLDRLLRRVQPIAGVVPFENILDRFDGPWRPAFHQQIDGLVETLRVAATRAVVLQA